MDPLTAQALISLLAQAMVSGVKISRILSDAKELGGVSDGVWSDILLDIFNAEELWERAKSERDDTR